MQTPDEKRAYQRQYYREHKAASLAKVLKREKALAEWVTEVKVTRGCQQCGETHPACLQYHHRNPSQKTSEVSDLLRRGLSKQRIQEEIDKCDVLCANCHAKLHWRN